MTTEEITRETAATYFESWRTGDIDRYRSILADGVEFIGPMAHLVGADDCAQGLAGLATITTKVDVQHVFVDGADALTWFELHTTVAADPIPVANWTHVENGKITRIRVTFDPRSLLS